jgi:acetolactate synthase I/III small subunit
MSPPAASPTARHHIVTAVVENKAGVLARVASLFSRRGYNIFSLAVAPTHHERFSRITIVVDVESAPLEQIIRQLDKLINVVNITELAPAEAVERELLLVTVAAGAPGAVGAPGVDEVMAIVDSAEARVVDRSDERLTIMLAGTPTTLDDFEDRMEPLGIIDLQRTGRVALPKLGRNASSGTGSTPLERVPG